MNGNRDAQKERSHVFIVLNDEDYNNWNIIGVYENIDQARKRKQEYIARTSYTPKDMIVIKAEIGKPIEGIFSKDVEEVE